jgi:hypothetical protein
MADDLKLAIREEYVKCAQSPAYFMRKYCYIQHPQRGRIQFNLYPFQEKVLTLFQENPYSIVLKSRQLGISTLAAGYSLWLMLFHKDKNILCIATKQETAKNMVTKVKFMYESLPSWLKSSSKPDEANKLTLRLPNGSQIKATSASSDAGRSEAVSLLIIDEAAFIHSIGEIWASAQQTLATGGGCIALSTPYGTGNWFHQTWVSAEMGDNSFLPIRLPWQVHPERDQVWRNQQDKDLGSRMAAQECDCDFTTSGDTVFTAEDISFYEQFHVKEPLEKRGTDQNLWIWEPVDYSRSYMIVADIARGDGKDYSAFHIFDVETFTQVGEYKGQIGTKEYGHLLVSIATEYNNALLAPENSSVGWSTVQTILDRGYQNLYYSPKGGTNNVDNFFDPYMDHSKMTPGFTMSNTTRPISIGKLQEAVIDKGTVFHSARLLEEMKVFIWKNSRPEAQSGYNDDLIMSLAMAVYVSDSSFSQLTKVTQQAKTMLESWQVTSYDPPKEQYFNPAMPNTQYKTNIAYQNQPTQKDYQDYLWVFGGYKR